MKKNVYLLLFALTVFLSKAQFNYYFGNIHSQTSYSDGNKDSATSLITTPGQAYTYAKASQHVDFYGVSDHNHLSAGMKSPNHYHMGIAQANAANQDGSFVAMYGQEWGVISGGGHVVVYGTDSLMGWDSGDYDIYVAQNDYATLWNKIVTRPATFAYLAHPQQTDYTNLFTSSYNNVADAAIVGMAARSGPAFSTNNSYSNPSTSDFTARYDEALSLGYHLGIGLDHDTHNSVFGRQTAGRLVVIAPALTRYNVMDAIKNMRIYSSDDWAVQVNFNIQNQPMGSVFTSSTVPTLSVSVFDPAGSAVSSIEVHYGVPGSGSLPTVLTTGSGNSFSYTHNISSGSTYYYYCKITQADGDVIWTSPIWYTYNASFTGTFPATNFSVNSTYCVGQTVYPIDLSTNSPTKWLWTAVGATNNNSTNQNAAFTYTAPGTYSIVLVASNGNGTGLPLTQVITVGSGSSGSLSVNSATICPGQSAVLNASGSSSYVWSTGATTPSISVSPSASTIYTVSNGSTGCAMTGSASVTVLSAPSVSILPSTTGICGSQAATLTASGASSYSWSTGSTSNNIVVSPSSNTTYTVIGTSGGGCSASASQVITVGSGPALTVSSNSTICSGATANLNVSGASTYSWSTGATSSSIFVSPASSTVYYVTGSSGSCSSTKSVQVLVNATPTLNLSASSTNICSPQSATLSISGASSYSWSNGSTSTLIVVSPSSSTTYSVVGIASNGCSSANSIVVNVGTTPALSVSSGTTICSGFMANLSASGVTSYSWSTGATSSNISVSPASTTVYYVTGSNGGCSTTASVQVFVNTSPTLNLSASSTNICSPQSATLSISGASSYSWSNGSTSTLIVVSPSSSTTYSVVGIASNGCSSANSIVVNVGTTPALSVSSGTTICAGNMVNLFASGAATYSWSNGAATSAIAVSPVSTTIYYVTGSNGGCALTVSTQVTVNNLPNISISASNTNICMGQSANLLASGGASYVWNTGATSSNININPLTTTIYSVTGTDMNGCINTSMITVSVSVNPAVSISSSPSVCAGGVLLITANGANSYLWSNGANTSTILVNPYSNTTYSVVGISAAGCTNTANQTIAVYPTPYVSLMSSSSSVCAGSSATLLASGSAISYSWSTGQIGASIAVSPSVSTVYSATGYNSYNCGNTATISIIVNPLPFITITSSQTLLCTGQSATLTTTGGGLSYLWNTGATTSVIVVSPMINSTFNVTVSDLQGCKNTAAIVENVSTCTGVNETANANLISDVWPNPTNSILNIQLVNYQSIKRIILVNQLGQVVRNIEANNSLISIRVDDIAEGLYFLVVKDISDNLISKKIIINY
ncbi:MAG: T9SS type A sorting domain-containing protein [Bacteroidetes bacterium]|nr:T9SS type A sorting domain-containing protein [Bacteroidota bacterium]